MSTPECASGDTQRHPEERTLGLSAAASRLLDGFGPASGWSVSVGHAQPFAIPGVVSNHARLFVKHHGWGALISLRSLRSSLGGETDARFDGLVWLGRRLAISAGAEVRRSTFDGFMPSVALVAHVSVVAVLSDAVRVASASRYEKFDIAGPGGAANDLTIVFSPVGAVRSTASLAIDESGMLSATVGVRFALAHRLAVGGGYASDSASLAGFATVTMWSASLTAGAMVHPVLGVTRQVWLRWGG